MIVLRVFCWPEWHDIITAQPTQQIDQQKVKLAIHCEG